MTDCERYTLAGTGWVKQTPDSCITVKSIWLHVSQSCLTQFVQAKSLLAVIMVMQLVRHFGVHCWCSTVTGGVIGSDMTLTLLGSCAPSPQVGCCSVVVSGCVAAVSWDGELKYAIDHVISVLGMRNLTLFLMRLMRCVHTYIHSTNFGFPTLWPPWLPPWLMWWSGHRVPFLLSVPWEGNPSKCVLLTIGIVC